MVAVLVMSAPLAAEARPFGHGGQHMGYANNDGPGMHRGGWFQGLTPEKQQAVSALFEAHRAKTQPIREQLWIKNTTLDALSANPKVEPKEITAMVEEIAKLRSQLNTERKNLAERIEKETGMKAPYATGSGFGGYGHHGGRGGYHKGGYGRGGAW